MPLDFLGDLRRTQMCGELRPQHTGKQVVLLGWVNRRRDLGNVIFIDIRDRSGMTQLVFDKSANPAVHEKASALRSEYVIAAIGKVRRRDADTINKNIATGEVEVTVDEIKLLNESKLPPFLPSEAGPINEEVRLKYRYIDLRREKMQANIQLRHNVALAIRQDLAARGFLEIETPFMTRSTPEGARGKVLPDSQSNIVAQLDIGLHVLSAQVDIPILQPNLFIDLASFAGQERRQLGFIEQLELVHRDFNFASGYVRVDGVGIPPPNFANRGDDIL